MEHQRPTDPLLEMSSRQGRHMIGARMLHITTKEQEDIKDRLARAQWRDSLSDAKVAGIIGVSSATISLIKSGNYPGDNDKYMGMIKQWLDSRESDNKAPVAQYIPTQVGEKIRMVCNMAIKKPCIGLVKTPSGWGKTAALQEVSRQVGSRCCYIQAGEASAYKRDMLYTLSQSIGVPYISGNARVYSELCKKMARFYAGGAARPFLIIVDEATTLKHATINMLRNLHDDSDCRTAIVFADTVSRLDSFLYARNNQAIIGGNEQLRSRGNAQCVVDGSETVAPKDVAAIASATAAAAGYKKKLDAAAIKYLVGLAAKPGALRNVVSRIENVAFYAAEKKTTPEFNVAQLDFVASLSGDDWTMKHTNIPFGNGAVRAAKVTNKRKRA